MNIVHGNLWDYADEGWIVVTTNIGWKMNGDNVMGAGIAAQAKERFPDLPNWYGAICVLMREDTPVLPWKEGRLIMFPTKPLIPVTPWRSWSQDSDIGLVERSLEQLKALIPQLSSPRKVFMTLPGCGNGNLSPEMIQPLVEKWLGDDKRVTLVLK